MAVLEGAVVGGRVVFRLTNGGQRNHRPALVPLPEDVPPIDVQVPGSQRRPFDPFAGVYSRRPGTSGTFLAPGTRYAFDMSEIRWNALDGPLMGTVTGTSFSTPMTIPEAAPGLYAVIALVRQPGGSVGSTARTAFDVTDAGGMPCKGSDATGGWNGRQAPETTVPRSALALAGVVLLGLGVLIGFLGTIVVRRSRAGAS